MLDLIGNQNVGFLMTQLNKLSFCLVQVMRFRKQYIHALIIRMQENEYYKNSCGMQMETIKLPHLVKSLIPYNVFFLLGCCKFQDSALKDLKNAKRENDCFCTQNIFSLL